jgi:tetratricopeptide (TPR) repeat protein
MHRGLLFVLCGTVLWGQIPQREPFDVAIQAYRDARASGDFDQARNRREEARSLLAQTRLDSPQLANRVATVADLYRSAGWNARARVVVEDALSRANSLGESNPLGIQLLNMLADTWQHDGNLLRAVVYREKIVAVLEASPGTANPPGAGVPANRTVSRLMVGNAMSGPRGNYGQGYQQLADLYRQLGRPEAAAKVLAKMRSLMQGDARSLASSYEREGNFDEAVALYKKLAEQAAVNPQAQGWEVMEPLQSIANLYQSQQRWDDAAATLDQAAGRLEAAGLPGARNQAVGMRLRSANLYQQAGQSQAAEKVYQALLAENANDDRNGTSLQVLQAYAQHLSNTKRVDLAEEVLKSCLANHPDQETAILFALSGIERNAGRSELAEEFQQAAMKKQRASQPQNPAEEAPKRVTIGPDLQRAQAAASQGNLDEAMNLTLNAMGLASLARDGEQVGWQVANIAGVIVSRKGADKAERLFHELLALLQSWAIDNTMPLLQAQQQYAHFLIGQKDRWGEAPAAIEQYRENLVLTRGAETSELEQVMNLRIALARARGAREDAAQAAEELLAFQESLSGNTSAGYLRAAQTAAGVFQYSGDPEKGLALYRQIIGIADVTLSGNDERRGSVRISAAFAFVSARRFDEAERMANEAIAVAEGMRPARGELLAPQVGEIRRLIAAQSARTDGGGTVRSCAGQTARPSAPPEPCSKAQRLEAKP